MPFLARKTKDIVVTVVAVRTAVSTVVKTYGTVQPLATNMTACPPPPLCIVKTEGSIRNEFTTKKKKLKKCVERRGSRPGLTQKLNVYPRTETTVSGNKTSLGLLSDERPGRPPTLGPRRNFTRGSLGTRGANNRWRDKTQAK